MDYAIVLSGEIDLEFDSDEVVHLKAGDVVIQRSTTHTWVNKGSAPAVTAFILIDAKPVEVNGKEMRTVFPVSDGSQKLEVWRECDRQPGHKGMRSALISTVQGSNL